MSDPADPIDPTDDLDLKAGEYVLGALPLSEARALEVLALTDPSLAASIAVWETRLSPLAALVQPAVPPPSLWGRLSLATGIDVLAQGPAAPRRDPGLREPGRGRGGRGIRAWRALAMGATAVAAGLAFLLYTKSLPAPEPLMAALSPYGGPGATFLVRVGADGTATVVAVGDTNVPAGRALELWAVTEGAAAPVSMGLLPVNGRARITVPAQSGTQLLVSQEPAGGSPTKQPTGPVVYAGKLTGV